MLRSIYSKRRLPSYHIDNGWYGGVLPTVFASWQPPVIPMYPIIIAVMNFVVGLTFLPETKDRDISRICLVKVSMSTFPDKETDKWAACQLNIGSSLLWSLSLSPLRFTALSDAKGLGTLEFMV